MTLRLALLALGVVGLILILGLSYLRWRPNVSSLKFPIRSFRRMFVLPMANLFQLLRVRFSLRRNYKSDQREPSLVSAADFELGEQPVAGNDVSPVPGQQAPDRKRAADYHRTRDIAGLLREDGVGSGPLRIDYWARLSGDELVDRDSVLSLFREYEIKLEHPRAVHGRSHPGRVWLDLEQAGSDELFADLVVSLQLAGHSGPVEETELTRFNSLIFALAEGLHRRCHLDSSIEDALPQARRLDRFCKAYDMLAILNIEPIGETSFSGKDIERVMQRSGMRLGDQNIFHYYDPRNGSSQFSLANRYQPGYFSHTDLIDGSFRGMTMFMSIPRCTEPSRSFGEMVSVAEYLASELNGSLADPDSGRLSPAHLALIQRQVNGVGESMKRLGVTPGGEEALRLF